MWRAGSGLVVAVACAGCLDIPAPQRTDAARTDAGPAADAAPETLVGLTVAGNGTAGPVTIAGTGWSIRFPATGGVRLPDLLSIDGVEVLGHRAECSFEDGAGLAIYPALSFSGDHVNNGTTTNFYVAGSTAVAQVVIDWTATYSCPNAVNASGTTGFTFFPDGRIVRNDRIRPTSAELTTTTQPCGCMGTPVEPDDYFLTSYLALQRAAFGRLRSSDGNTVDEIPLADLGLIDDPNPTWACVDNAGGGADRRFAVVWTPPAAGDNNGTRIRADQPNVVFIWDWLHSASTIPAANFTTAMAWLVRAGAGATCDDAAIQAAADAYLLAPDLRVEAGGLIADFQFDRNLGLYLINPSPVPATYTLTARGPIAPRFAVQLVLPSATAAILERDGVRLVPDVDYLDQAAESQGVGMWLHSFWFRDGLALDSVITVRQ